jgi:adenylosuccinate synthase
VNCYTQLNLTKLDVLDGLKKIKVATAYTVDGQDLETFPADLDIMESSQMEIVYKTFEGWQTNS